MWSRRDNQEVGLEAATLERVRNSSLVKWFRADNVAGLKHTAEAVAFTQCLSGYSPVVPIRRAGQGCGWVGERRVAGEAAEGSSRGRHASENAGMSSERGVRTSPAGRPRVPGPG
jgi:hypothetical protein